MKSLPVNRKAQAGFTLIELIVVIVILGILAATALPRMFDMSGQARLAKMQGALGAVRAASSSAHAQWLVSGGLPATTVKAEGVDIPMFLGYPDVGGDAAANTLTSAANSGIFVAAGLSSDYKVTTIDPATAGSTTETKNKFTVYADDAHPKCRFTYEEATTGGTPVATIAPKIDTADLILANCE